MLLPIVAYGLSPPGRPIGEGLPTRWRDICCDIGKNALDRLIEIQARGAGLRGGRAHGLDVERFLTQDLVNMLPRRMMVRLRFIDRRMIGADFVPQDLG